MKTLTPAQQAEVDHLKAIYDAHTRLLAPLSDAIDTAARATRHNLVTDRTGALDLCNAEGGLNRWRYVDAPLQNLLGLAIRRAVRQLGGDPETIAIPNDLSYAEQDAWPLCHALILYGRACYGPDPYLPLGGETGFLRLRSVADFSLCAVWLTADTQQLLVDAIHATVTDLEGVWS